MNAGGRPAAQLSITLRRGSLRAKLRMVAYPGTPVLRQWVTLENQGTAAISLPSPRPVDCEHERQERRFVHQLLALRAGTSRPNQGLMQQAAMGESYHHSLLGERSDNLVPWTAWQRKDGPADGCYVVALDYQGTWNISSDCVSNGPAMVSVSLPALADFSLAPGQSLDLPVTTTGVFHRSLDDMGAHLYDWQYQYMWDHANPRLPRLVEMGRGVVPLLAQFAGTVHGSPCAVGHGRRPDARDGLRYALGRRGMVPVSDMAGAR